MAGSGQIFSGILQSAAYTNLDGVLNRSGWRWMFIIDGIISLPIALAGFLFYPSFPDKIKPGKIWSAYDIAIMRERMRLEDRKSAAKFTKSHLAKIFGNWKVWVLPWLMIFFSNTQDFLQVYTFWWVRDYTFGCTHISTGFPMLKIQMVPANTPYHRSIYTPMVKSPFLSSGVG